MSVAPRLKDYDIKVLVVLGNQTNDIFHRNYIKNLIINKLLEVDYSLFFLLNSFMKSNGILKEVYAEIIVMKMKNSRCFIDDITCDQLVKLVSIDTLMYYGMESDTLSFMEKCRDEFWKRAIEIEDKVELNRKVNLGKKRRYKIINKRRGVKNDKY